MDRRNGTQEPERSWLGYHFLAAVDIEAFSRLDTLEQVRAQNDLGRALEIAALASGLDRDRWALQGNGDGELAVLPPGIDGPRLVADFPRELSRALAAVNRARRPVASRLRVRLALHHGPVADGAFGPAGTGPIVISRLIDLDPLRAELRRRHQDDLVLIVSPALYDDVIKSRFRGLDPADFHLAEQKIKGIQYTGYIRGTLRPSGAAAGPRTAPPERRAAFLSRRRTRDRTPAPAPRLP